MHFLLQLMKSFLLAMGDGKECTALELSPVKFSVQVKDKKIGFVGQRDQKLHDAIRTLDQPGFSITDHILFTDFDIDVIDKVKPKQKVVEAAILPSLLCGWLKEGSVIDMQKLSKKKAANQPKGNPGDSSRSTDGETIFFVQTDGMKAQDSITVLSDKDYKFRKICVSAVKGVSFAEALEQDGRFVVNIDRWEITNKEDESYIFHLTPKHSITLTLSSKCPSSALTDQNERLVAQTGTMTIHTIKQP